MKYRVDIIETYKRTVEIEATDEDEAIAEAWRRYNCEEIVLNNGDYDYTDIELADFSDED